MNANQAIRSLRPRFITRTTPCQARLVKILCSAGWRIFRENQKPMRAEIAHIAYWVHDLERMREFYLRWFGATGSELYTNASKGF